MYDLGKGFGGGRNQLTHDSVFDDGQGPNGGGFSDKFPNVVQGNKGPFDYGGQRLLAQQRPKGPPPGMGMAPPMGGQPPQGIPQSMDGLARARMPMGRGPMRV